MMIEKPSSSFPASVTYLPAGRVLNCKRFTASSSSRPLNLYFFMITLCEKIYMMINRSLLSRSSLGFVSVLSNVLISFFPTGLIVDYSSKRAIYVSFAFFYLFDVLSFMLLSCDTLEDLFAPKIVTFSIGVDNLFFIIIIIWQLKF